MAISMIVLGGRTFTEVSSYLTAETPLPPRWLKAPAAGACLSQWVVQPQWRLPQGHSALDLEGREVPKEGPREEVCQIGLVGFGE